MPPPGSPSYSVLSPLIHFYLCVAGKPKRKCDVSPDQDVLPYLILGSLCELYRLCQFSGIEHVWLVSLLVTFAAIWAKTCVCLLSPAGQGLGPEFADASLGLRFRDSHHLLVICRYSGVRGFQRFQYLEFLHEMYCLTAVQLPIRSQASPSAESNCHEYNDNVLCTSESFTPSSCPPPEQASLFMGLV